MSIFPWGLHYVVAIYRGCFDDFGEVGELSGDYVGCRDQSWNNRRLPWCLCDTPFCNGVSMRQLSAYSRTDRPIILNTTLRKDSGLEETRVIQKNDFKTGDNFALRLTSIVNRWHQCFVCELVICSDRLVN